MVRSLALLLGLVRAKADVAIATFDGAKATTLKWTEQDDPVMGGRSKGSFTIDADNKVSVFNGTCAIVPYLKAPGFIKATSSGPTPDVSECKRLVLNVKSKTDYKGFRISFSNAHYPFGKVFAYGYKANLHAPVGKFGDVELPFNEFSNHWDDATGEPITKCADDPRACPTKESLRNMKTISLWAEGAEGDVNLQIKSIRASGCEEPLQDASAETTSSNDLEVSRYIDLATFDGKATHKWHAENDPVMGGRSSSEVKVMSSYADFKGATRIVPALGAPGFTIAMTEGFPLLSKFPDVSSMDGLTVSVRSLGNFSGYKVAFCDSHTNFYRCQAESFKADLEIPTSSTGDFQDVFVPWSKFSDKWNAATGKHTAENHPIAKNLKSITQLQIWTEAVEGDFHLQFQYVRASKAPEVSSATSTLGSLVTFDGAAATTFRFGELNDPVMGGRSRGKWSLGDGFGILDGEVVNVPALRAPGFIKAAADGKFPDVSDFIHGSLVLSVRTTTPEYTGYRVTFVSGATSPTFSCAGGGSLPFSRGCFKQKFSVPAGSTFVEVKLPFNTFSDKWSSATGEHTTECAKNKDVCPTATKLSRIQRIEFWGEGAAGKLHLEVQSVSAEKASGERIMLV